MVSLLLTLNCVVLEKIPYPPLGRSLEIPRGRGVCLLIQQYFCAVYDYVEKADLSKGYQNPKRKLGVTMHFSEIIEVKY